MQQVAFVKNRNFIGADVIKHPCLVEYSENEPIVVFKASQMLSDAKANRGCEIVVKEFAVKDYEFHNGVLYMIGKDVNSFESSTSFDYNDFKQSKFSDIPVTL